jgi:chromosome segregation protein
MLKALDIVGFKSFADRTRFEFPPGITVVVGPNGSGKSNVVDAIKWVLGEQSVKSLRGREMTDVIFNGSSGRRAVNAAEITITLDNSKHLLKFDAPEVHITRRVYRSGEGEYLINRNPARLRDIRDLLSGTGMGTQAYSIIEQGKVDVLLQASPRDRRAIFEEAAGISRFKLRKVEALRRLERVEQNLLRLSDIVDEVDSRLRGIRVQAGKARRYKEHTARLQELRTQVAQVDWQRLSGQLAELETQCRELGDQRAAAAAEAERLEAQLLENEHALAEANEDIRQAEALLADNREKIATAETAAELQRNQATDLQRESEQFQRQLEAAAARAEELRQQLQAAAAEFDAAEQHHREVRQRLEESQLELQAAAAEVERLRAENQARRAEYLEQMRLVAALGNEVGGLESQAAAAQAATRRGETRLAELDREQAAIHAQLEQFHRRRDELADCAARQAESLAAAKEQLADQRRQRNELDARLDELRRRQSGLCERAAVLDDLIHRLDGLGAGVKDVLRRAADGAFPQVHGLVADLMQVGVETAPLVEIALGETAQHVVATRSAELLERLRAEAAGLEGRVGFVWLDVHRGDDRDSPGDELEGLPGVLGRADRFVETAPRFVPLARRLLGRVWFVDKLDHALSLAAAAGAGASFVTLRGELLQSDGTLVVGPRNVSVGLISRRSQLRALRLQLDELEADVSAAETALGELDARISEQQARSEKLEDEHHRCAEALAANALELAAAEERRSQLERQRAATAAELEDARRQADAAARRLDDVRLRRAAADSAAAELEAGIELLARKLAECETRRGEVERRATEIKVELAKDEERLENMIARRRQLEESSQERQRAIAETQAHLADRVERAAAARRNAAAAEAEIAELYGLKQTHSARAAELSAGRDELHAQRGRLSPEVQNIRVRLRKLEEQLHAAELAANEIRLQRGALADRLREDYGIELADLERQSDEGDRQQREDVQREIEELRQKIANLGNVNLEALDELDQLETRYKNLSDQHQDLVAAKAALEKIIERINADSRRLFSETLESIKGHFQSLFRDLFGGGQADVVLEENVDILEAGVEIIARPPGKEPRNISLLSGGEKTMTCVALLLAIFRSRPSPFCVFDEVDAAMDEANIDRFTQVLKDFLAWTQFIIVTHSKRTMTAADTIYGVTMQESGVTKQVSVRFEDISDDGEILAASAPDDARIESKAA